jgi:hypothetical protein
MTFSPSEFSLKKPIRYFSDCNVDVRSELSRTYGMIIGNLLRNSWRTRQSHKLNDVTFIWDTVRHRKFSGERQRCSTPSSFHALI